MNLAFGEISCLGVTFPGILLDLWFDFGFYCLVFGFSGLGTSRVCGLVVLRVGELSCLVVG